jgi:tRNA nucleotidyltransferase/poly(A) polymerase
MDVQRRDLTINGLLCDPLTGEVFDYVGGLKDLEMGIIRFIGDAEKRVMEDALRLLRWVRFICRTGMVPDPSAFDVTQNPSVVRRLQNLSGERVRDEILGILSTERAALGMTLLHELGIIEMWLPEMEQLVDYEQNVWHSEDVWGHTLMTLDAVVQMGGDLTDRVTAFFHDVGKGVTRDVKTTGVDDGDPLYDKLQQYGYSFHSHDVAGVRILDESIVPRLKMYGPTDKYDVDMDRVKHLIGCHMHTFSSNKMRMSKRLKHSGVSDFGMDMLDRSLMLFMADTFGRKLWLDYPLKSEDAEPMWKVIEKGASIKKDILNYLEQEHSARNKKEVAINGHVIMNLLGIRQGRKVGDVINHLFDLVTESGITNEPTVLEQYVVAHKDYLLNLPEEK